MVDKQPANVDDIGENQDCQRTNAQNGSQSSAKNDPIINNSAKDPQEKAPMLLEDDDPPDKTDGRCCGKLCKLSKGTTRPNYKYISLMFAALFASSFTLTFLFPFLPEMVKWFGYSEEEKGMYVGLIASAVFAGRACGSFFWGWLSDVRGRKLVLLLTIAGNAIFSLLFGLATNLPMAMFLRFMSGLANGTVGTAKTVLYEISDNTNQAIGMSAISLAWGCGLIMGPTIGGYLALPTEKYPSVFSPDGFFHDYPFFLPSLVTMLVCCVGFAIVFFKFEETLQKKTIEVEVADQACEETTVKDRESLSLVNIARSTESVNRRALSAMSIEDVHCAAESEGFFADKTTPEFSNIVVKNNHVTADDEKISENINLTNKNHVDTVGERIITPEVNGKKEFSINERTSLLNEEEVKNFFNTDIKTSTTSLSVVAINQIEDSESKEEGDDSEATKDSLEIVYEVQLSPVPVTKVTESTQSQTTSSCCSRLCQSIRNSKLVTLMGVSDIRNSIMLYTVFSFGVIGVEDVFTIFMSTDPNYNGLGFSSNEIGLSMGVVSVPLLIVHLAIFPAMVKKFGIKKSFLIGGVVLVITVQTLAMLHPLHNNPVVLWVLLLVILLPERLAVNCCFSGASLMINNSCTPENAGTVNGIAMTCTAIARTMAPTVGGGIFSWSISYGLEHLGPPFDHNLVFIFFGVIFFLSVIECLFLPERLNKQTKKT